MALYANSPYLLLKDVESKTDKLTKTSDRYHDHFVKWIETDVDVEDSGLVNQESLLDAMDFIRWRTFDFFLLLKKGHKQRLHDYLYALFRSLSEIKNVTTPEHILYIFVSILNYFDLNSGDLEWYRKTYGGEQPLNSIVDLMMVTSNEASSVAARYTEWFRDIPALMYCYMFHDITNPIGQSIIAEFYGNVSDDHEWFLKNLSQHFVEYAVPYFILYRIFRHPLTQARSLDWMMNSTNVDPNRLLLCFYDSYRITDQPETPMITADYVGAMPTANSVIMLYVMQKAASLLPRSLTQQHSSAASMILQAFIYQLFEDKFLNAHSRENINTPFVRKKPGSSSLDFDLRGFAVVFGSLYKAVAYYGESGADFSALFREFFTPSGATAQPQGSSFGGSMYNKMLSLLAATNYEKAHSKLNGFIGKVFSIMYGMAPTLSIRQITEESLKAMYEYKPVSSMSDEDGLIAHVSRYREIWKRNNGRFQMIVIDEEFSNDINNSSNSDLMKAWCAMAYTCVASVSIIQHILVCCSSDDEFKKMSTLILDAYRSAAMDSLIPRVNLIPIIAGIDGHGGFEALLVEAVQSRNLNNYRVVINESYEVLTAISSIIMKSDQTWNLSKSMDPLIAISNILKRTSSSTHDDYAEKIRNNPTLLNRARHMLMESLKKTLKEILHAKFYILDTWDATKLNAATRRAFWEWIRTT